MDVEASFWFLMVVKKGSFSNAARELNVPVSTISRRVAKLEEELGFTLLRRNTRHMQLTESGTEFLELSKQLDEYYLALKDWQKEQSKIGRTLRITAPTQFIEWPLSEWVIEFKLIYPEVNIELVGSNENLDFFEKKLDLAFRQGPLVDSELIQKRLFNICYGIFASPQWISRNPAIQDSFSWLKSKQVINVGSNGRGVPWMLQIDGSSCAYSPSLVGMLFDSPKHAIRAAVAGLGIAHTPIFYAHEELNKKTLQPLCESIWPQEIGFYLVFQGFRQKSKTLSAFVDFVLSKKNSLQNLPGIITF